MVQEIYVLFGLTKVEYDIYAWQAISYGKRKKVPPSNPQLFGELCGNK